MAVPSLRAASGAAENLSPILELMQDLAIYQAGQLHISESDNPMKTHAADYLTGHDTNPPRNCTTAKQRT